MAHRPVLATLALALLLALTTACAASAEAVHADRKRNEAALVEHADAIAAGDATQYVLVEAGEVTGRSADLAELLQRSVAPTALHRFVYRPVDHAPGLHRMTFLPAGGQVAGLAFAEALGLILREGAGGSLTLVRGRHERRFAAGEPRVLTLTLSDPDGAAANPVPIAFDPAFDGPLLVRPDTAAELGLERFEVPGRIDVQVALGRPFRARRALVRVRLDELDVEGVVLAVFETR